MADANSRKLLLCDCGKTMKLDAAAIGKAAAFAVDGVSTSLCTSQQEVVTAAMAGSKDSVTIACTQFRNLFEALAEDAGAPPPGTVNIREMAGWSDDARASPKIAALLGLSRKEARPARLLTMASHGRCLIYGGGEAAIAMARELSGALGVTVMLAPEDADDIAVAAFPFAVTKGRVREAAGHFTDFNLVIDDFAELLPHSRSELEFGPVASGVESQCDILVDLAGGTPLFTGWERRDGYFRAAADDTGRLAGIAAAAAAMIGEFEKPIYVDFDENLCAHSRNGVAGCTRCLDACPAGAITSAGDTVAIDPHICGGCGYCGAVCPSGAAQTNLLPVDETVDRIATLARVYREAGGKKPDLLIHDGGYGLEAIDTLARFGKGLPASLIPYEMHSVGRAGHDVFVAALASGFARVLVLANPRHEHETATIRQQIELAGSLLGGAGVKPEDRLVLIDDADPDRIGARCWERPRLAAVKTAEFTPLGAPRAVTRLALRSLAKANGADIAKPVPLPAGAPYGRVEVDTENCTVCLSCAGACPAGALQDNPDAPQLLFREDACLQCGICVATCPEGVISLVPQFNLDDGALATEPVVEDEPFACTSCGKVFGTTRSIQAIVGKLSGHGMFADSGRIDMLKMCEDCRVGAIFSEKDSVADVGERKRPRTTDDYME